MILITYSSDFVVVVVISPDANGIADVLADSVAEIVTDGVNDSVGDGVDEALLFLNLTLRHEMMSH